MRIIFLGSGEFGLPTLKRLCEGHEIVGVVSQPDRPAGRKRRLVPTPIADWAQQSSLSVFKTEDVNDAGFVEQVKGLRADAGVVIAFGQKLGQPLIEVLGRLAVNLHASLLPKYRGAAPINWAIIKGEQETGLSVIGLSQRMDGGAVYGQSSMRIDPLETAGELHDRLADMGPDLLEKVLAGFEQDRLEGHAQDESLVTKAPKLSKADGVVSFDADAQEIRSRVHGLTPWPGARVVWVHGADLQREPLILRRVSAKPDLSCFIGLNGRDKAPKPGTVLDDYCVAARDGAVRLLEVQAPGGRPMGIDEFVRGHPIQKGDRLESFAAEG